MGSARAAGRGLEGIELTTQAGTDWARAGPTRATATMSDFILTALNAAVRGGWTEGTVDSVWQRQGFKGEVFGAAVVVEGEEAEGKVFGADRDECLRAGEVAEEAWPAREKDGIGRETPRGILAWDTIGAAAPHSSQARQASDE